ncbi:hypothetical protein V8G54_029635 [Vigna mungo]|uniref:Transposase MuDR plant domain-containing protein n=1 Tax=Vigna mungo TaxID=3915 RepID=A0AAQ3MVK9_VIGMU
MTSSQSCSFCSNTTDKGFSHSSHGVVPKGVGITPICHCGDIVVTKVVKTARNVGSQNCQNAISKNTNNISKNTNLTSVVERTTKQFHQESKFGFLNLIGLEIEVGDFLKWLREEAKDNHPFHCWRRRGQSRLLVMRIEVIKESLVMDEERIKIVVHHSGHFFTDDNGIFKFDGEIAEWTCDANLLSYFGIVASVKELGHMDIKDLWYGLGGQFVHPDRLELLNDDKGVMHMFNITRLNDEVHLYVVHNMVEPQIIEFIDLVGGEEGYGVDVEVHTEGDGQEGGQVQVEGVEVQVEGGEVQVEVGEVQVEDVEVQVETTEVHVEDVEVQVEAADVDEVQDGEVQGEVHHVEEPEVHEVDDFEVEDLGEDDDVEDGEGDELHENESEAESEEEDLHDVSVQCDIGYSKGNVREEHSRPVLESSESSDNENNMHDVRGLSDNEWLSEELISDVEDSEGEEDGGSSKSKTIFPTFSMPRSLVGYKWEVGTFFVEKNEFMDAIRTYALSNGRNLKFIKNDKKRICVKCLGGKGKCNWYAYCAFRIDVNAWHLRKVVDTHSCSRDFNVKLMTSKWLSERMEKSVRENPTMKVMDIRDKGYQEIWLLGQKPWQKIKLNDHSMHNIEDFMIMACKDSFVSYRPIVGLDGCFLKTKYGGELLTTVRRDGNEQMLPIAYVVVEVENKESWTWFLEMLIEDLGGKDVCAGITFISDQQKGLLAAFQDLLPGVEQRFTPRSQCDTLVNNMSEAFNSVLVDSRSKPIISMLEDIRVYIMKRWAANRTKMTQYQASICPKERLAYRVSIVGADSLQVSKEKLANRWSLPERFSSSW